METISDLLSKAQKLVTDLDALAQPAAPLATQSDLDSLGTSLDAAAAKVAALTPAPPTV